LESQAAVWQHDHSLISLERNDCELALATSIADNVHHLSNRLAVFVPKGHAQHLAAAEHEAAIFRSSGR